MDSYFHRRLDPDRTEGFSLEVKKNTFETYDGFFWPSLTNSGTFYNRVAENTRWRSKPFKDSGLGQQIKGGYDLFWAADQLFFVDMYLHQEVVEHTR